MNAIIPLINSFIQFFIILSVLKTSYLLNIPVFKNVLFLATLIPLLRRLLVVFSRLGILPIKETHPLFITEYYILIISILYLIGFIQLYIVTSRYLKNYIKRIDSIKEVNHIC